MKTNGLKKEFLINKSNVKEGIFQMKRFVVNIVLSLIVFNAFGQVKIESVRSKGIAPTYRSAINKALIRAIEQHDGGVMSAAERAQITHLESSFSINGNAGHNEITKEISKEDFLSSVQKVSKGRILGYDILFYFEDMSFFKLETNT